MSLARDALDLWAEYTTCTDDAERQTILQELRAVDRQRQRYDDQAEALDRLPEMWEAIYGAGVGYLSLFCGRRQGKRLDRPQETYFPYPQRIDDALTWVRRTAAAELEVYQCAHLTREQRRRKATAAPLTALYVDLDGGRLDSQLVPPPSVVVESSPGRLQCYWQLQEPIAPATGEQLNRQLAHALGADKSGWDLTQLLRVPGTLNHKYVEAPLVKVIVQTGRRYDLATIQNPLAELRLFAPPLPEPPPRPALAGPLVDLAELALTTTARRTVLGELPRRRPDGQVDRSASLVAIARVLAGAGVLQEMIVEVLAERDATLGWRKFADREDAARQYGRIAQLVTTPRLGR